MKRRQQGFTLIEMLVVMGIIAVLAGALMAGFSHITRNAQRARAQEAVSNFATALSAMLQKNGRWPTQQQGALMKYAGRDGNGYGAVELVAKVFAYNGMMGVSFSGDRSAPKLLGTDRCGIVDPWAQAVLKRTKGSEGSGRDLPVPTGGKVQDHIIYYALDGGTGDSDPFDGITEASVCGEKVRVRASAIAWCAGADGKLVASYSKRSKENSDNVYSWRRAQEVKK